ncbi:MAG: 3-oxoacyl-ACP reductase FabG [Gammaproteobacteria bacterium]|nr:3-oxoacyl-ACP reductase FabG [Gammaproteobacteria bacterium]
MKHALVTGASGAIGAAICRSLAARGLHVFVHGHRHRAAVDGLVGAIRAGGGQADGLVFDVTDAEQTAAVLGALAENTPIQVLVNNAGIHDDAPLAGMTQRQWHRVVDVSLDGFFNVTQPLLLPMMATRWGRIVSLASITALAGNRGQANYAAAKAGLIGASKSLSLEVAARGITVNVVAPGIIRSPMTDGLFPEERLKQLVPMRRAGEPAEVADLVAFLTSEQASYISGQVISINGGML